MPGTWVGDADPEEICTDPRLLKKAKAMMILKLSVRHLEPLPPKKALGTLPNFASALSASAGLDLGVFAYKDETKESILLVHFPRDVGNGVDAYLFVRAGELAGHRKRTGKPS